MSSIKRQAKIDFGEAQAVILLGPRKTGKTTFLQQNYPSAVYFDLLKSEVRADFQLHPENLRHIVLASPEKLYILDEIQKVPGLLDEVHWLIENTDAKFILCGSSARKLKRGASNLLGGRAYKLIFFPLVFPEIKEFDLIRAFNHGLIPQHYLSKAPDRFLHSYIDLYLQEEIIEESKVRKLQAFQKFLEVAALGNGDLLNYANVAKECGVSAKSVREYYQILEDTLVGFTLSPWAKVKTRRLIETAKFYLFDLGVIRTLKQIQQIVPGTVEFGGFFETFLIHEVRAFLSYNEIYQSLSFWRTSSGLEVDLIVGNMELALEFKSTENPRPSDSSGLMALMEENKPRAQILVCRAKEPLSFENGINVWPYQKFLKELWNGNLIPKK